MWSDLGLGELWVVCLDKNTNKNRVNRNRRNRPWRPSRHTAAMVPHSRQLSIQQSTNIICEGAPNFNPEKILIITINMTTFARRVDDDVRRRHVDDETRDAAWPAGRIRRRRRHRVRLTGVGDEGGHGGDAGRGN